MPLNAPPTAAEHDRGTLTREWALNVLRDVVERSIELVPVLDSEGLPTGDEQMRDAGTAVEALAVLARMEGWNAPEKVEQSGSLTVALARPKRD